MEVNTMNSDNKERNLLKREDSDDLRVKLQYLQSKYQGIEVDINPILNEERMDYVQSVENLLELSSKEFPEWKPVEVESWLFPFEIGLDLRKEDNKMYLMFNDPMEDSSLYIWCPYEDRQSVIDSVGESWELFSGPDEWEYRLTT